MAPSSIPPKPTWYGGMLFRSRLEARWAKFWTHLDIKWEYELEKFGPEEESAYIPDFVLFLARGTVWAEIKSGWAEIKSGWAADPGGVEKWRRFVAGRPQPSRAILIAGVPSLHNSPLVIGGDENAEDPLNGPWEDDTQEWRPCPSGHHFDVAYPGQFGAKFAEDGCPDDFGGNGEQKIADASAAACMPWFNRENPPTGTAA